jgi:hypothetical protein
MLFWVCSLHTCVNAMVCVIPCSMCNVAVRLRTLAYSTRMIVLVKMSLEL